MHAKQILINKDEGWEREHNNIENQLLLPYDRKQGTTTFIYRWVLGKDVNNSKAFLSIPVNGNLLRWVCNNKFQGPSRQFSLTESSSNFFLFIAMSSVM